MKLLIHSTKQSNRLRYTFDLIFKDVLGVDYEITDNKQTFINHDGAKLNYSVKRISEQEVHIVNVGLLFRIGIQEQSFHVEEFKELPTFYQTNDNSDLPFDPFAASFYLVSRYEEYLPYQPDQFGRFPAKASVAYQNGFLKKPVVNHYANWIKELILEKFPETIFPAKPFEFMPTYDVDAAYAIKYKGLLRTVAGIGSSLIRRDMRELRRRFDVIFNGKRDPYDTFDYMISLQKEHLLEPKYFFLVGDYDEYDKNVSLQVNEFRYLIKSINDYAEVGIHPSFASNQDFDRLKMEVQRLSGVLNKEIRISRQHFLKLHIPNTYQRLIELEVYEDHSMGYASEVGFRASICAPFYFYDLDFEAKTKLKIYPFAVMDVSLNLYLNLLPDEAIAECKTLIDEVNAVGGKFITLWHNQNLSNEKEWRGWVRVYEKLVEYAASINQ